MSLKEFTGGAEGGDYLTAEDIGHLVSNRTEAEIIAPPYIGERTFGDETKKVCEFPMKVEGEERKWSAGKFATMYLTTTKGPETGNWKYPMKGHFEYKPWKTSKSSGVSAHFIPDYEAPKGTVGPTPRKTGTQSQSTPSNTTGTKNDFKCKICGSHFSTSTDYAAHAVTHIQ